MQVPYLILCSENDNLAPFQVISNFFQRLKDLGGDVKLLKWSASPHVGQYLDYLIHLAKQQSFMCSLGKVGNLFNHKICILHSNTSLHARLHLKFQLLKSASWKYEWFCFLFARWQVCNYFCCMCVQRERIGNSWYLSKIGMSIVTKSFLVLWWKSWVCERDDGEWVL